MQRAEGHSVGVKIPGRKGQNIFLNKKVRKQREHQSNRRIGALDRNDFTGGESGLCRRGNKCRKKTECALMGRGTRMYIIKII